jgi:hypothetical protein
LELIEEFQRLVEFELRAFDESGLHPRKHDDARFFISEHISTLEYDEK